MPGKSAWAKLTAKQEVLIEEGADDVVTHVLDVRRASKEPIQRFGKQELIEIAECPDWLWGFVRDTANEKLMCGDKRRIPLALVPIRGRQGGYRLRNAEDMAIEMRAMKSIEQGCLYRNVQTTINLLEAGKLDDALTQLRKLEGDIRLRRFTEESGDQTEITKLLTGGSK